MANYKSPTNDPRHQTALDRFHLAVEVWREQREQELQALNFQAGDQWPPEAKAQRAGNDGSNGQPKIPPRPMLTIRSLDQPIAQVVNQARQSELAIVVKPRGSEASKDIADTYEGLIRKIQVDSHAQSAYLWAYQRAVPAGMGYFRINKKMADDATKETESRNDQDATIERILNGGSVYLDPFAQDSEWRDGDWAFVTEDIPETRYKAHPDYKDSKLAGMDANDETFTALGDELKNWVQTEEAGRCYRVAEYFYRDGGKVMWGRLNGVEWIDKPQEWDGSDIPIVPVLGIEYNVAGKRSFEGIVTPAIGPCRMLNFMVTAAAEQIGLTTRPKWKGYKGQFEGMEEIWDQANTRNISRLEAHAMTEETGANILPLPELELPEAPIEAMSGMIQMQVGFIRSITGVPDASLGHVNPNDKSGKAIQALQQAAEQGTSNYLDNLARSIKRAGEILVNLIPKIYDRPGRVVQLLAADGKQDAVMLGTPFVKGPQGPVPATQAPMNGTPVVPQEVDLAKGKYAVVVEVAKNFNTRQEQTRDQLLAFAQIAPELFPKFADLVAKTLGPEGDAIAERVKPPGVDDNSTLPPQIQQQVGQMQAELQQAKQIIAMEQVKHQADIEIAKMNNESKERIAAMQAQASLIATDAKINSSDTQALLKAEFERLGVTLKEDLANVRQMLDQDHQGTIEAHKAAHQAGMLAEQQAHAKMLQDQQQTHEAAMGIQGHQQALEQGQQGHEQALEQQAAAPQPEAGA